MKLNHWLRKEVERLEREIRNHSVFTSSTPATQRELLDLRKQVAIHTYLKQQLLRRAVVNTEDLDTREEDLSMGYRSDTYAPGLVRAALTR